MSLLLARAIYAAYNQLLSGMFTRLGRTETKSYGRSVTHYYENLESARMHLELVCSVRVDTTALSTAGPDHPTLPVKRDALCSHIPHVMIGDRKS